MSKINWHELKGYLPSVIKMDDLDSAALFQLYETSSRMCNESNNNVEIATVSPSVWFDDLVDVVMENVGYVAKSTQFQFLFYKNPDILSICYSCDVERFNSLNDLKDFIKKKGQFSTLVLFSIVKYVDLHNLNVYWSMRYKEILDTQQIREKKIEYLTK